MTQSKLISIVTMWSKINELSRQSLSQMQIALTLGISRDTVRRYQRMSEKEFEGQISSEVLRRRHTAQATIERLKIMPPPRSTIDECDDRSFGLSMMLKWSAILK